MSNVCHFCQNLLQKEIDKTDYAFICNDCIHYIYNIIDENKKLKQKYNSLENEFREYVNRPEPTNDYISGGGWRR